jgi:hypothetical protein
MRNRANCQATSVPSPQSLLESRLAYHLRCSAEDAIDPELPSVERLALVPDRARRMREIRRELVALARTPREATLRHP